LLNASRSLTGGLFCERVIEAVGKQWPLDLAGEITAERGKLIVAGYHQDGPHTVNMWLWNWRGIDVINAHERDPQVYMEGMREAVEAVASGRLDPSSLYTHRFKLDELSQALDATRDRPTGFLKAIIEPGRGQRLAFLASAGLAGIDWPPCSRQGRLKSPPLQTPARTCLDRPDRLPPRLWLPKGSTACSTSPSTA